MGVIRGCIGFWLFAWGNALQANAIRFNMVESYKEMASYTVQVVKLIIFHFNLTERQLKITKQCTILEQFTGRNVVVMGFYFDL